MDIIHKVFVSSTYQDLREERAAVQQTLIELKCFPIGMEIFPASSEPAWEFIKRQIDDSDYYILIVAARYGSIHPVTGLSYTEMEYDYASSKEVPIFAFLHGDLGKIPNKLHDPDQERRDKLASFRSKVQGSKLCKLWTTLEELDSRVAKTIVAGKDHFKREGFVRASLAVDHKKMADIIEKNGELEKQLRALGPENPKESFAHGEQEKRLGFFISGDALVIGNLEKETLIKLAEKHKHFRVSNPYYEIPFSWDEILWFTGHVFMVGCNDNEIDHVLCEGLRIKLADDSKSVSSDEIGRLKVNIVNASITDIITQFLALQYIEVIHKNTGEAVYKFSKIGIRDYSDLVADKNEDS